MNRFRRLLAVVAVLVFVIACASTVGGRAAPLDADASRDSDSSATDTAADSSTADAVASDPRCPHLPCLDAPIIRTNGTGAWIIQPTGETVMWGHFGLEPVNDRTPRIFSSPVRGELLSASVLDVRVQEFGACALMAGRGGVLCWGVSYLGELGQPLGTQVPHPVQLPESIGALAIGAGTATFVVKRDAVLMFGQRPGGGYTTTPIDAGFSVGLIREFGSHVYFNFRGGFVTDDHVAYMFGQDNAHGELGDGTTITRPAEEGGRPTPVLGLRDVVSVQYNHAASCALRTSGAVSCWGRRYPMLTTDESDTGDALTPTDTGIRDAIQLAMSTPFVAVPESTFACVVTRARRVRCWGRAPRGELGIGVVDARAHPPSTEVDLPPVREIAVGTQHVCALTMAGDVYCWGTGDQLGRSSTATRPEPRPVRVALPM